MPTRAERRLRVLLYAHAALCAAFVAYYLASGIADHQELRFVVNSTAKDGLFCVVSLLAAADVRRRGWMTLLLVAAYAFLLVGEGVMAAFGDQATVRSFGTATPYWLFLGPWMAVDAVLLGWLGLWWWQAERERWELKGLNPPAFRTLIALAEVLIDGGGNVADPAVGRAPGEAIGPEQVARNVDRLLGELEAPSKGKVVLALTALAVWPLLTLRMPFAAMAPEARERYLRRRFIADVAERRTFAPLRPYVQAMIRTASQMAYLGYYGDRRTWSSVHYVPFKDRPGGRAPEASDRPKPALVSRSSAPRDDEVWDTVVIGSGAAGAIAAYRIAEGDRSRRVLVLERGPHVDPREFDDDEVEQYLRLYNEGALQIATDFRLQVLQGMCVGGSTTVNNAVCLDPPRAVLEQWAARGVDADGLEAAIAEVREWLPVRQMSPHVSSPAARRWAAGVAALGLPGRLELVHANIREDCVGCGYCNIGCAYGKKLSMLDAVLPWAQRDFPGRVEVLPRFHAERIVHEGGRATGVLGRLDGGAPRTIRAREVVLAAGAVASSWVLRRSGIGGERPGAAIHFNINSPLTAEFPEPVHAYAGLQMSHAYLPDDAPGWVLETWFNPPATQALAMPGWFERHFENMRRYDRMACAGVLVGTTTPGSVAARRSGPELHYEPSRADLGRILDGLEVAGDAFFAAGAERVLPATFAWHEYRSPAALRELRGAVRDNADLLLTTAHPQGGNPIGDPRDGGVVDRDFRVHGFENLFCCDASVFPGSVTVNPQLTVMGMAQLAAGRIAAVREAGARRLVAAGGY